MNEDEIWWFPLHSLVSAEKPRLRMRMMMWTDGTGSCQQAWTSNLIINSTWYSRQEGYAKFWMDAGYEMFIRMNEFFLCGVVIG